MRSSKYIDFKAIEKVPNKYNIKPSNEIFEYVA